MTTPIQIKPRPYMEKFSATLRIFPGSAPEYDIVPVTRLMNDFDRGIGKEKKM